MGLCLRGIGPALSSAKGGLSPDVEATQRMYVGLASLVFAALAFSLLGVMYQTLVSVGDNPPSHSEIMLQASVIGEPLIPAGQLAGTAVPIVCNATPGPILLAIIAK